TFVEIGDVRTAVVGAVDAAKAQGFAVRVLGYDLHGEAQEAARTIGAQVREAVAAAPAAGLALIWGSELTVTVGNVHGEGGRCQEFAAALIPEIAGLNCVVAIAGTDGVDFVPGVGGAVVTGGTAARIVELGLDLDAVLREHNTAPLHRALGTQ